MPPAEWTSDSSSESDGSEKDPFAIPLNSDLVIPSPVTLSDAEEDASPSQYRKEMASKEYSGQSDYEDGQEEEEEPTTTTRGMVIPRNLGARTAVISISDKLGEARAKGINAWNLSKLVEEEWDKLHDQNDITGCIALTTWYVAELQSRKLTRSEYGRIGQMTKRFGRISLLAIDVAASKDLDDLCTYAFRVAQKMYAEKSVQ